MKKFTIIFILSLLLNLTLKAQSFECIPYVDHICSNTAIYLVFPVDNCVELYPQYVTYEQNGNTANLYYFCFQGINGIFGYYTGPADFCVGDEPFNLYLPGLEEPCQYNASGFLTTNPLPLMSVNFALEDTDEGQIITWDTYSGEIEGFEIYALNNDDYRLIYIDEVIFNGYGSYRWMAEKVLPYFYFQVKEIQRDGSEFFSEIMSSYPITNNEVPLFYPNPIKNFLFYKGTFEKGQIFNTNGELMTSFDSIEGKLDLSYLPTGVYILKIDSNFSKIVIKQ